MLEACTTTTVAEKKLLYTKVVQAKPPKRRSRAGCSFCKLKKRKCDEGRPSCGRCQKHGKKCHYERFTIPALPQRQPETRSKEHDPSRLSRHDTSPPDRPGKKTPSEVAKGEVTGTSKQHRTVNTSTRYLGGQDLRSPKVVGEEPEPSTEDIPTITPSSEQSLVSRSSPPKAFLAPMSPLSEFSLPVFSEVTQNQHQRFLIDHFCNTFAHLIVLHEDESNPFQQLILPLSYNSLAVKNAICALSSAHLEAKGVAAIAGKEGESVQFHNEAICNLAQLIEGAINKNELLAAIMLLVYYEVLVQKRRHNLVQGHLKGAMAILSGSPLENDSTGLFLQRAFSFYDVIAALSLGTSPVSGEWQLDNLTPPSFSISRLGQSNQGSVDALLGFATTLWPVIHKLSTLLPLKTEVEQTTNCGRFEDAAILRSQFDVACSAVELALDEWQPTVPLDLALYSNQDGVSQAKKAKLRRLLSILNTALAYQHSAIVYLYRTVYDCARSHDVIQRHAHTSLLHCEATVRYGGPMGALLWPLFVASCEAISSEDRSLANDVFAGYVQRQSMTNIERSWHIVREVWQRADAADESDDGGFFKHIAQQQRLWKRVIEDMGVNIVFG